MNVGIDVFLSDKTIVRRGLAHPDSALSFEEPTGATGTINLYLGHIGRPDHAECTLAQLRNLEAVVYAMLLRAELAAAPVESPDDPDDEPSDEPAVSEDALVAMVEVGARSMTDVALAELSLHESVRVAYVARGEVRRRHARTMTDAERAVRGIPL